MEKDIERLTVALTKYCGGQNMGVVIGANLNMIMTAAQLIPDRDVRRGIVHGLRNIADQLDRQNGGVRQ